MEMLSKVFCRLSGGIVLALILGAGAVQAQEARGTTGYLADPDRNVIRSGYGDCVHTGTFKPEDAVIVGCDGVTLDPVVEIIEGEATGLVATIVIPASVLFAFDSAELVVDAKDSIEEQRRTVRPELTRAFEVAIIGHTDSTGDPDYNLDLSMRRAQSVAEYLIATGVATDRLRVLGRGEKDPIASNDTQEGRAQNRRVEIVVVGEARALDAMIFPSVALFPRRSAELTPEGRALLEKNRSTARDMLRRATYVNVIGHTDDVGDDDYNQELSEQRANTIRNYLIETGADGSKIVALGAGERFPIASNTTDEGRAQNRRVEISVVGRLDR
jgi:outer membrane protein OmpA-like peptidoglycan-associated protein